MLPEGFPFYQFNKTQNYKSPERRIISYQTYLLGSGNQGPSREAMRGPPPQYQQGPDMMSEMPPSMGGQQVLRLVLFVLKTQKYSCSKFLLRHDVVRVLCRSVC